MLHLGLDVIVWNEQAGSVGWDIARDGHENCDFHESLHDENTGENVLLLRENKYKG